MIDVQRWSRAVQHFLAWLSTGEELPRTAETLPSPQRRAIIDVARWLLAADQLPLVEPMFSGPPRSTGGFARWLLSPEELPEAPPADSTARGSIRSLMGWLLTPERLPTVTTDDDGVSRPGVIRWLLAGERLPPPTDDTTTSKNQEA